MRGTRRLDPGSVGMVSTSYNDRGISGFLQHQTWPRPGGQAQSTGLNLAQANHPRAVPVSRPSTKSLRSMRKPPFLYLISSSDLSEER